MIRLTAPLLLLVVPPLLYLWWRLGKGPREVRALRACMVLLCALILASPVCMQGSPSRHLVLLADRSLSCGREAVPSAEEYAKLLYDALEPEDRLTVVVFGDGASALPKSGRIHELIGSAYEDASDLSAGLGLAAALLAGKPGGRILLITDGFFTGPDPMERVPVLLKNGLSVDHAPILLEETGDVAITGIDLPERVLKGHPFEISYSVSSPVNTEAVLEVQRPGSGLERRVTLSPGENRFTISDTAGATGLIRYTLAVRVQGDARPENNRALAVTLSIGPPGVLVLNQAPGPGAGGGRPGNVSRALEAAGMSVTPGGKGTLVTSADLKAYGLVVLENMPLSSLNDRADGALRHFVRETGGGLLVTGGRRSLAEGGYYQSRLEDVLPVSMMRKEEYKRPRVAMCIVLDRSGSMAMPVGGGLAKIDLANRAAAEAVGVLLPQDEAAVIAVDSQAHEVVGLTPVEGNREEITQKILSVESMGGGIFVYTGLAAAVNELLKSSAQTRHIALFSDAADSEEPGDYQNLVDQWVAAGGTISVIGLGTPMDQDAAFLIDIANRGGGEVFFTEDAHALPRIFCEDAIRIARKTFLEEPTAGAVSPEIVRIGRLGIEAFPEVDGYNLCYTKKDASELITTLDENQAPLLAVWQSGLGRAAALTCEADGPYTGALRDWLGYGPFFSSLAKWLQRERDDLSLFGTIVRTGRTGMVKLEMDEKAAQSLTGATAVIIPPKEGEPIKLPLRWASPRSMEAAFRLESDGIYHGVVVTREGRRVSLPPMVLPYSPEFEQRAPSAGLEVLEGLAAATGGNRVRHVRDLLDAPVRESREPLSAVPFLAGLFLLLLLCDIVTRKHLWGFLVPAFAGRGMARAGEGARSAVQRFKKKLERKRKPPELEEDKPPEAPPEPKPEPDPPEPVEEESVFTRAKRRSRGK